MPYEVNGEQNLIAGYLCTPLVKFPVSDLKPGAKVMGRTIAELGNRNRPLDMIVYRKDGRDYLLMSNTSRGVMKIPTEGFGDMPGLAEPVPDGNKAGVAYETVAQMTGVEQLDLLDDSARDRHRTRRRGYCEPRSGRAPVTPWPQRPRRRVLSPPDD